MPTSKWHFVPGLPNGSLEIAKVGPLATLGPHNFAWRSPIEMRSKAKLYPLSKAFQRCVACHLHTREPGQSWLLVVESQTTNLTLGPSFGHNLCFRCSNGSCEPILDIYILRALQWYKELLKPFLFDPVIALWIFKTPPGLHLPKWELPWECEGSFPHTFLHSREHAVWLPSFRLSPQPCKPFCLGREPKVKVATYFLLYIKNA